MHYNLDIQCRIWSTNQNHLIDFESDEASLFYSTVSSEGLLDLNNDELFLHIDKETKFTKSHLCEIKKGRDMFELELPLSQLPTELDDITWILLHHYQQTNEFSYRIREGDLFKIGKYILKVRQLRIKRETMVKTLNENKTKIKDEDEDVSHNIIFPKDVIQINSKHFINNTDYDFLNKEKDREKVLLLSEKPTEVNKTKSNANEKDKSQQPTCRICLSEEHDPSHPLINPCKCSGTMKFIHLDCLRMLIQSKITEKTLGCVSVFTFKSLECELCQTLFPEKIRVKEISYSIIDLHRPNGNYILLEGLMKEMPDMKTIYIVAFNDEKKVKIGRSSDSDFRLADISVSRNHAEFVIKDGGYYLYDTKSKFGSLIKAYKCVGVFPHRRLAINKSKICLSFKMRLKFFPMILCYKPKNYYKSENDYDDEQYLKEDKSNKSIPDFLCIDTQEVSLFDSGIDQGLTVELSKSQ